MVQTKQKTILTADFEAKYNRLVKEVKGLEHTPKMAVLRLLEGFRNEVVTYAPANELDVYDFMRER